MPLASAKDAVVDAVGAVIQKMGDEGFDPKTEWAKVAEAFFSQGLNPVWISHDAGKAAFSAAFNPTLPAPGAAMATFPLAWIAYAATASASTAPLPPGVSVTPPIGPPGMPAVTGADKPPDHTLYATQLFTELIKWAVTGLVKAPVPPGPPTTPWS